MDSVCTTSAVDAGAVAQIVIFFAWEDRVCHALVAKKHLSWTLLISLVALSRELLEFAVLKDSDHLLLTHVLEVVCLEVQLVRIDALKELLLYTKVLPILTIEMDTNLLVLFHHFLVVLSHNLRHYHFFVGRVAGRSVLIQILRKFLQLSGRGQIRNLSHFPLEEMMCLSSCQLLGTWHGKILIRYLMASGLYWIIRLVWLCSRCITTTIGGGLIQVWSWLLWNIQLLHHLLLLFQ